MQRIRNPFADLAALLFIRRINLTNLSKADIA
jgi:hypothetical protein